MAMLNLQLTAGIIIVLFLLTGGMPVAYGQLSGCTLPQQKSAGDTDKNFTDSVLRSWMLEIALAKEATAKADNPDVRNFADRLIQDSCTVDQQLTQIAQKEGLQVPGEMGSPGEEFLKEISALNGPKFDRAYIAFVITDHRKAIKEFSHEAMAGDSPTMEAFASQMVPQFKQRLSSAESINRKLAAGPSTKHPWWQFWKKA